MNHTIYEDNRVSDHILYQELPNLMSYKFIESKRSQVFMAEQITDKFRCWEDCDNQTNL